MKGPRRGPALRIAATAFALALSAAVSYAAPAVRDSTAVFDANEIRMGVSNLGWIVPPRYTNLDPGFEWPRGSGRNAIFAAGLWIGGRVGVDTIVTTAEYTSRWAAGPLDGLGNPVDPGQSDPTERVLSIRRCESPGPRSPQLHGEQTLRSFYNDSRSGRAVGIEVDQATYGFARGGDLDRVVFFWFQIHNQGSETLADAYVGFWFDPDLGGPGDDFVGCDSTLDLGFVYNADDDDFVYGAHTPAVGCAFLQGPAVGTDTLGMTSFGRILKNYSEPVTIGQAYRRLVLGQEPTLAPSFGCDGPGDRFEVSGDPVTGTGCLDASPADRRMILSSGPFTLGPGDDQIVVMALAVGGAPDQGDRLSNLTRLRATVAAMRALHRSGYANLPPPPDCDAPIQWTSAWPNPSREAHRIAFRLGYGVRRVVARIHDVTGRRVWSHTFESPPTGSVSFDWYGVDDDGFEVPAGIYWVRIDDGRSTTSGKLVRLR